MKLPIIMAAFGTTSSAITTYASLDSSLRRHFSENEVIWTYTSRVITRELQGRADSSAIHPEKLLKQLAEQRVTKAVIQSLHLLPGAEFHSLLHLALRSPVECAVGLPILTSPRDYDEVGELLRPLIIARPEQEILLLGHGTSHPVWTAYYSLEKLLRQKFQRKIHVGVVEKFPRSEQLADAIADGGATRVCIIPLFLVTGLHYRRDIISDNPASWKSRLEKRKIVVEFIEYGLGLYPGFERLIIRHIEEALQKFA